MMHIANQLRSPLVGVTANYERLYGCHSFEPFDGGMVSVVSAPDWDGYWETLQQNADDLGEIALGPELITSQFEFDDITSKKTVIEKRLKLIKTLSQDVPNTIIALGTPIFDPDSSIPTNSLAFFKDGLVVARKNKAYMHPYTAESKAFRTIPALEQSSPRTNMASLVCADLINVACLQPDRKPGSTNKSRNFDPSVSDKTRLVLMSACWSTPLSWAIRSTKPDEERYRSQLEYGVSELFKNYPNLTDLIIADRIARRSEVIGPLNCHYTRAA